MLVTRFWKNLDFINKFQGDTGSINLLYIGMWPIHAVKVHFKKSLDFFPDGRNIVFIYLVMRLCVCVCVHLLSFYSHLCTTPASHTLIQFQEKPSTGLWGDWDKLGSFIEKDGKKHNKKTKQKLQLATIASVSSSNNKAPNHVQEKTIFLKIEKENPFLPREENFLRISRHIFLAQCYFGLSCIP